MINLEYARIVVGLLIGGYIVVACLIHVFIENCDDYPLCIFWPIVLAFFIAAGPIILLIAGLKLLRNWIQKPKDTWENKS